MERSSRPDREHLVIDPGIVSDRSAGEVNQFSLSEVIHSPEEVPSREEQFPIICQILERYGFDHELALERASEIVLRAAVYPSDFKKRWQMPNNVNGEENCTWSEVLELLKTPVHSIHKV